MTVMGGVKELVQTQRRLKKPHFLKLESISLDRECLQYLTDVASERSPIVLCSFINVDFQANDGATDQELVNMLHTFFVKNSSSLNTLEIQHKEGQHDGPHFNPIWATVLFESAPKLTCLNKLKLDCVYLQGMAVANCLESLCNNTLLQQLDLRSCTFEEVVWTRLFVGLRQTTSLHNGSHGLRKLHFCHCKDAASIDGEALNEALLETLEHMLAQQNESLNLLALDGQRLTAACLCRLANVVQNAVKLRSLSLSNNPDLFTGAGKDESRLFGTAVGAHKSLQRLLLDGCNLGNCAAYHVFDALEQNQSSSVLQHLFLQQNDNLSVQSASQLNNEGQYCCWIEILPRLLNLRTLFLPRALYRERLCHACLANNISLTTVRFYNSLFRTTDRMYGVPISLYLKRNQCFLKVQSLLTNSGGEKASALGGGDRGNQFPLTPPSLLPQLLVKLGQPWSGAGANATPLHWAVGALVVDLLGGVATPRRVRRSILSAAPTASKKIRTWKIAGQN